MLRFDIQTSNFAAGSIIRGTLRKHAFTMVSILAILAGVALLQGTKTSGLE